MTKIVVVSDNHGLSKELEDIYFRFKDETDLFFHCGDSEMDEKHPLLKPYLCVNGNSDEYAFPHEYLFEIKNKRILIIHGHYHSVKYNLQQLYHYASIRNVDLVFYGHTHYPAVDKIDNILFINPGSILANRGIRGRSYAVVDIIGEDIRVNHYDVMTHKEYPLPEYSYMK